MSGAKYISMNGEVLPFDQGRVQLLLVFAPTLL